jgi:Domain of unknown function (DUF3127)
MWGYFTKSKTMELTGTILKVKEIEIITAKNENAKDFQKREFWLQVPDGKFSQTINLELHGDKVTALDSFAEGQEVTVGINLKGRIVEEKCFNTLQVWRIQEVKK